MNLIEASERLASRHLWHPHPSVGNLVLDVELPGLKNININLRTSDFSTIPTARRIGSEVLKTVPHFIKQPNPQNGNKIGRRQ